MKQAAVAMMFLGTLLLVHALACAGDTQALKATEDETKLLELTNQERKAKEVPPLRANSLLAKVARAHSANMARQQKMDHVLDGKTPFDRMREAGYKFQRGAENVASGTPAMKLPAIMQLWMNSKGHRENILNADYTEIGIGIARGQDGKVYYTQVFARPFGK
jgi:uncharacterized protein YkwD